MKEYLIWPNRASPEKCEEWVQRSLEFIAPQSADMFRHDREFPEVRSSDVRWMYPSSGFDDVYSLVKDVMAEAAIEFQVDPDELQALQFTSYKASRAGHYDWHEDAFGNGPRDRQISMVLMLTDPSEYKGGDLQLRVNTPPERELLRGRGTVIAFPSNVKHRVTSVTRGLRHTLVAWKIGTV